jgi:ribonuclease HI
MLIQPKNLDQEVVRIYTDGACSGNPGPGGWGALLQFANHEKTVYGYELHTTNNRMEIRAIVEALKVLKRHDKPIEIYTDSKYVYLGINEWIPKWINKGWCNSQGEPIKNKDLWEKLYKSALNYEDLRWNWIKGHSGNQGNERADRLANQGKEQAIKLSS